MSDSSGSRSGTKARVRILVITAPWCHQCRAMDPDLEQLAVPGGVVVERIDAETDRDRVAELGVRATPTLIRVEDGVEVWRTSGRKSAAELAALVGEENSPRLWSTDLMIRGVTGVALVAVGGGLGALPLVLGGVAAVVWGLAGWVRSPK